MRHSYRPAQPSLSRRDFVRVGAAATVAAALPTPLRGMGRVPIISKDQAIAESYKHPANEETMKALVTRAIDAAKSAGARYADARVTRTVRESNASGFSDSERLCIGVRALVDGAWGFAASPYWTMEEAALLAKEAVSQARINAAVFPREIELGTYPVATGSWTTPIRIDPFQVSPEEKIDLSASLSQIAPKYILNRIFGCKLTWKCERIERAVATSEGALFSQTFYITEGKFVLGVQASNPFTGARERQISVAARGLERAGQGWERLLEAKIHEQIPALVDEAEKLLYLEVRPVDVGRYEMVMPAHVSASLVTSTLARATQLDRAFGYEANAGGTSYFGPDPLTHLGTTLGSPLLTVHGDRSLSKGLATVKWDDEGVEPDTFPIVSKGVLTDYQTAREQASWLAPWYAKQQRPVRSHGCAVAAEAQDFPMQHTPNLIMQPGPANVSFDEMVQNTKKGIAFMSGHLGTDFQSRTGFGGGTMREIINGKLGAVLLGAGILFDATQIWKNLLEIGGADSVTMNPMESSKGQPYQYSEYSVTSVPARFKEMTVIDIQRKGW